MRLIELHILQSFPVTCLNRDDVGAPKSALFGGVSRARVSSQCWKRAIRSLATELQPAGFAGKRGHYMAGLLSQAMIHQGVEAAAAQKAAEAIADFLGDRDKKYADGHKTSVALYLSPLELEAIAGMAAGQIKEQGKVEIKKGDLKKAIAKANVCDLADIAVFGRMVASDHTLAIEGAGMFSHALSTHETVNEVDFFSAVDDIKPEDAEGAGHIGTLEFNSACYYRYAGLDWDRLCDAGHLGHLPLADRNKVVDAFVQAAILAVPAARHNSMFGHNPPQFVLGLVRIGQPLSLVNAFESPVRPHCGYVEPSCKALNTHLESLKKIYGGLGIHQEARIPDQSLKEFTASLLNTKELHDA